MRVICALLVFLSHVLVSAQVLKNPASLTAPERWREMVFRNGLQSC